jgi:hypothetical protein
MAHFEQWVAGGPPHQTTSTTAGPYGQNPSAIPSDLSPLTPTGPSPPRTGVSDLEAVKAKLASGVQPPR